MEFLCKSRNGVAVDFEPRRSHVATHFRDNPALRMLVAELVKSLDLTGEKISRHFDMGREIGVMDVVPVGPNDHLIYAVRKNRQSDGLVPFVLEREGMPCRELAVDLVPQKNGRFILESAWIGPFETSTPPFPQSPLATSQSIAFWKQRAFVWGSQEIDPETMTETYPWGEE